MAMEDAASRIVTFSEGKGQVAVPDGYDVSLGESGDLQLLERTTKKLRVYATFHDLNRYGRDDAGEVVVLSHAQKNNLQLMPMGDRIALVEPGKLTADDDDSVLANLHWQIGFGNYLVVLTATFPRDSGRTPELELFLGSHWEPMVKSFKSARAVH